MAHQTKGLNPFLPFDTYIPDGEPKVFGDRVYLYGSCDRFGGGYCCDRYRVFSAPLADLTAEKGREVVRFHRSLPFYRPTPLVHLRALHPQVPATPP